MTLVYDSKKDIFLITFSIINSNKTIWAMLDLNIVMFAISLTHVLYWNKLLDRELTSE